MQLLKKGALMRKKVWVYSPFLASKNAEISESEKSEILNKCEEFIKKKIRPKYAKMFSSKEPRRLADIYVKWRQNSIIFIAVFDDFRPDAINPKYEDRFARLRAMGGDRFGLDYMRHTEKWQNITFMEKLTLKECFANIEKLPHFEIF